MNRQKLLGDTPFKSALSDPNSDGGRVNQHDASIKEYRLSAEFDALDTEHVDAPTGLSKVSTVTALAAEFSEDIAPTSKAMSQGDKPLQNGLSSGYRILSNSAPKGSLCFKPLL